jgi:hypothetical protein
MMGLGLLGWLLSDGYQGFWGHIGRIAWFSGIDGVTGRGFGTDYLEEGRRKIYTLSDLSISTLFGFVQHYIGVR